MTVTIRLATEEDAASVLDIYAPLVMNTPIAFEKTPPLEFEMRERIRQTISRLPWLVCVDEQKMHGYLYVSEFDAAAHESEVYQWSVISSIYVHEGARRKGIANALYRSMFSILLLQGFYNVYAGITLPNPASVGLHEALGFQPVGVYRSVGFRMGAWRDVGWWQYELQHPGQVPHVPLPLIAVEGASGWNDALAAGLDSIKM